MKINQVRFLADFFFTERRTKWKNYYLLLNLLPKDIRIKRATIFYAILDALLEQDPMSRVACETCTTTGLVMVMVRLPPMPT